MMDDHEHWIARLSDFLDGELAAGERAGIEAHLAECTTCRGVLDELRTVVDAARRLEDRGPATDLWPAVAAGIAGRAGTREPTAMGVVEPLRPRRRFSFTVPQLAAAAVVLMLVSGTAVWLALPSPGGERGTAGIAAPEGARFVSAAETVGLGAMGDDRAIAELEDMLARRRDRLDPVTVELLERNLAIIDQAIDDARRALARDPGDPYLNDHLTEVRGRKLEVLQRAAALVGAET